MNRIMSTSIILLDQNFNANYVDIMVFEPSVSSPRRSLGIDDMVLVFFISLFFAGFSCFEVNLVSSSMFVEVDII